MHINQSIMLLLKYITKLSRLICKRFHNMETFWLAVGDVLGSSLALLKTVTLI